MDHLEMCKMNADLEALRAEVVDLKERLLGLTEASINICNSADTGLVFQEVVNSVSKLTGARYGALLTLGVSGGIDEFYTYGISPEQRELMDRSPQGLGLLGYINKVKTPVNVKDLTTHPEAVGLPENHPSMKTFLGVPMYHQTEHVGNLYLTEKEGGLEFSRRMRPWPQCLLRRPPR